MLKRKGSLTSLVAHRNEARSVGDQGSIPGSGKLPGEGNGNPLQYSCLENPHGQRSLAGYSYSPRGHKELDMTECCLINRFRPILTPGLKSYGPSLLLELDILMLKRKGSPTRPKIKSHQICEWVKQNDPHLKGRGFPGDSVVKYLLANAGNTGSVPDPGRSHRLQNN